MKKNPSFLSIHISEKKRFIHKIHRQKMECPICFDLIQPNVNCVTTDCGHSFHTSCLMKNTAMNGYDCPYCRTQMAEAPPEDAFSEYGDGGGDHYHDHVEDDEEDYADGDEEEEEYTLLGFRWFFQQIHGEELEGDAVEYEQFQKEERDFDEESDKMSEEAKAKIDNVILGLKQINTISYEDLLKAFIHVSIDKFPLNHDAEEAFQKVHSTINSISERSWT